MNSVERKATGLPARPPEAFPPPLEPIAFLVEQAANMSIPGHYHQADQFQVFVAGGGKFGIKPIEGLTVHYAMGFTPYAPIHAAEAGVEYYTLRNGWDPGARWMPDYKEGLKGRTKDYRHGLGLVPALLGDADGPKNLTGVVEHNVVPFEADGLGATLYHAAPGQQIAGPAPSEGRGCVRLGGAARPASATSMPRVTHELSEYPESTLPPARQRTRCRRRWQ